MIKLYRLLAAVGAACGLLLTGPVFAQSACSLDATAGTVTRTIGTRSYNLYVPPGLVGSSVPLLLSLHGATSNPSYHENETGWDAYASTHNFIVAYPAGVNASWDLTDASPDVAFLKNVAADVSSHWCVNPKRVHVEGYSRGAMMAHRLACSAADTFASVTAYAGYTPQTEGGTCAPSRPIGVGVFHSTYDVVIPYYLGQQARDYWVKQNGCNATPVSTTVSGGTFARYTQCQAGVEVWFRQYNQSHNWPTGADGTDILDRMWAFFQINPLP